MNLSPETLYQMVMQSSDLIKNFVIIFGGGVALLNFVSQNRQKRIDNAFSIVRNFWRSISDKDIEVWKQVFMNSTEMMMAEPGMFVLFKGKEMVQHHISELFIPEGFGFYVEGLTLDPDVPETELDLSCIRRIAEELEIIGYEILHGQIEFRIVYYELGQIMRYTYILLIGVQNEATDVKSRFGNFLKVCKKFDILQDRIPCKVILPAD